MPEGAARIERIDLEGVRLGEYVFVAHTKPPRFAIVGVRKDGGFWAAGPLTREQLDIELGPKDEVPLSAEGREASADGSLGYTVEIGDVMCTGKYPDGPDNAARNLARFVLGISYEESVDKS